MISERDFFEPDPSEKDLATSPRADDLTTPITASLPADFGSLPEDVLIERFPGSIDKLLKTSSSFEGSIDQVRVVALNEALTLFFLNNPRINRNYNSLTAKGVKALLLLAINRGGSEIRHLDFIDAFVFYSSRSEVNLPHLDTVYVSKTNNWASLDRYSKELSEAISVAFQLITNQIAGPNITKTGHRNDIARSLTEEGLALLRSNPGFQAALEHVRAQSRLNQSAPSPQDSLSQPGSDA